MSFFTFDLSKISNFNIYFWKSTDESFDLNNMIYSTLDEYSSSAIDWKLNEKIQCKKAFDVFTTFTGTTSKIIDNYSNSDIVCVLAPFPENFGVSGTRLGYLYFVPEYYDSKIILFVPSNIINSENIKEGGNIYYRMIQAFGLAFGLVPPNYNDTTFAILQMPALPLGNPLDIVSYPNFGGYIQNNISNTIMSETDTMFFLPSERDMSTNLSGYAQSLMPLDALALRWMYDIEDIPEEYINTYGVHTINPSSDQLGQMAMIVGHDQTITFGSNNNSVNFYLTNQCFTFYNLQPIKYEYNRPIEKPYGFYPKELDSTISTINLNNTGNAFIFIQNCALNTNLTINILNNSGQVLNVYCMDLRQNYLITGNVYLKITTNETFTINNPVGATVNVYFNK